MFASSSISRHLARGVVGLGAMITSLSVATSHPWLALGLLPVALVALRGCPTCWTVGLFQTVHARLRGKSAQGRCADGTCGSARSAGPDVLD